MRRALLVLKLMLVLICAGFTSHIYGGYYQKWSVPLWGSNIWIRGAGNTNCDGGKEILVQFRANINPLDSLYLLDGATGQVEGRFGDWVPYSGGGYSGTNQATSSLFTDVDGDGREELILLEGRTIPNNVICYKSDCGPVGVNDGGKNPLPATMKLGQNYPNPFNPNTQIEFDVRQSSRVTITIYNTLGQTVKTLVDESKKPGQYSITWDGTGNDGKELPSGIYFYALKTESAEEAKKMLLLK